MISLPRRKICFFCTVKVINIAVHLSVTTFLLEISLNLDSESYPAVSVPEFVPPQCSFYSIIEC
ncbi:hypothetical protein DPMN_174593 [Dreissena polymorpha]|uniref:Uncharacterized protein n=1 Tax=Dreissena polymorpha TaxID=45954 RepID=A0A9D4E7E7_DREPO|nr:hypothetical protein DPMN_174593 [Dreissena polymorpha]